MHFGRSGFCFPRVCKHAWPCLTAPNCERTHLEKCTAPGNDARAEAIDWRIAHRLNRFSSLPHPLRSIGNYRLFPPFTIFMQPTLQR
eukprot:5247194-Pyramimonas_sp.AAC.1